MIPSDPPSDEALFIKAKDAALRFLAYRARSEAEVRRRLSRNYPQDTVERVVQALTRQNLLDDTAFAQQWRANREQHRPRAKRMLQQELRGLGVAAEVVQATLAGFNDEANAYQAGYQQARRLMGRNYPQDEFRKRLSSYLQRRGFGYGIVRGTVERLCSELGPDALNRQGNTDDDEHYPENPDAKGDSQQT